MKLKAAVIGLGFVGRAHVEALRRLGIAVCGAMGSSKETTASAYAALGLEHGYASIEELAADASVDVVHICTPITCILRKPADCCAQGSTCFARSR
jgi:predicted dehydrogenase